MRRIPVEDLGELAEAGPVEVLDEAPQDRGGHATSHALTGVGVDAEQERPHRALVVGAVALDGRSDHPAVIADAARPRAQPDRHEELALDRLERAARAI